MISERALKKMREEALKDIDANFVVHPDHIEDMEIRTTLNHRILRLTQDLLDQYLIKR